MAYYLKMLREAEEDGEEGASTVFSQVRDVEGFHAGLYKKALDHLIAQRSTEYDVCSVCGYVSEREPPERCPVYGAPASKFEGID